MKVGELYIGYLWFVIPISYAIAQGFELAAVLGRIAGIKCNSNLLGYTIQQTVNMGTRFFTLMLMPALGYMVDKGISPPHFRLLMHISLALAGGIGLLIVFNLKKVIRYHARVIFRYRRRPSLMRAFVLALSGREVGGEMDDDMAEITRLPPRHVASTLVLSSLVYWVYAVGFILTFYVALIFPHYRTTLTQLSGAVNAASTVVLTLLIEPRVSHSIDDGHPQAIALILAMFWGRLIAIIVLGHLVLLMLPQ